MPELATAEGQSLSHSFLAIKSSQVNLKDTHKGLDC